MVIGKHSVSLLFDIFPIVMEDLFVAEHPVAVVEQKKWGPSEHSDAVGSELIVKCRGEFDHVSDGDSFTDPLVEQVQGCEREEQWHTHSVHASDIDHGQDSRVFEMDDVVWTRVKHLVLSH